MFLLFLKCDISAAVAPVSPSNVEKFSPVFIFQCSSLMINCVRFNLCVRFNTYVFIFPLPRVKHSNTERMLLRSVQPNFVCPRFTVGHSLQQSALVGHSLHGLNTVERCVLITDPPANTLPTTNENVDEGDRK